MKLKVCGMREAHNIEELAKLQPDYMGFIFWEPSKRFCSSVPTHLAENIQKVGVFVDASIQKIKEKIATFDLQAVQLHGNESPFECEQLHEHATVIKAFRVDTNFDFELLEDYVPFCDYFLFDTQGPLPGGNGTLFDWNILRNYPFEKPFFLSGGISLKSIDKIVDICQTNLPIHALDINSKFEDAPGLKNIIEIQRFKEKLAQ